jgi:hypothetical protein
MLARSQRMQRHLLESGHLLGSRLVRLSADSSQNLQLRQGSLSSPTLYQCFGCFLGHPEQLVRETDPDPAPKPSIMKQKKIVRKILIPTVL